MTKFVHIASITSIIFALACTSLISGCATQPENKKTVSSKPTESAKKPVEPVHDKAAATNAANSDQIALQEGINAYNEGDYNGAIKKLSAPEISAGSKQVQLDAHKYMAFSYCVTSRQSLCKAQFEKALKLDPKFDLAPGENGHPLWGPSFERAKKSK